MTVGLKDLDKHAYNIVCNWYKSIDFNPVHEGIDYSYIIRFYLWDKVGRAIRLQHGIDFGEIESYKDEFKNFPQYHNPLKSKGKYKRNFLSRKKVVFIPYQSFYTKKIIQELQATNGVKVISKVSGGILPKKNVIKAIKHKEDKDWSDILYTNLIKSLSANNVNLIPEDILLLEEQIYGVVAMTNLAIAELDTIKPHAVYVHSDNHPPYINYVLAAKRLGIPTFTYQHGLDCEYYYYDDCFADFVALWSEDRRRKYELNSVLQPEGYKVVGNVFLEKLPLGKRSILNTILFITRPHKSLKCYSPSRSYKEGLDILNAIIEYLKNNLHVGLIIKPHPMDLISLYNEAIMQNGMQERIKIKNTSINELLCESTIVVTEDSTAGVEVMRFGIPVVHANFSGLEPILPLVEGQAALRGFCAEELFKNIEFAFNLDESKRVSLFKHQKHMTKKLIPKGEVNSIINYILENI